MCQLTTDDKQFITKALTEAVTLHGNALQVAEALARIQAIVQKLSEPEEKPDDD